MIPLITKDPAVLGILFYNLKYFIILYGFFDLFTAKYNPQKHVHDNAK